MTSYYKALYISGALLIIISLFGGNLTKPVFNKISENTLEAAGLKKSYIHAADEKIDDTFFEIRKIEYQIERLKKIFSAEKVDESQYQREQNNLISNNFYNPLILTLNYVFRLGMFLIGVVLILAGIIVNLMNRSRNLNRRISNLESMILREGSFGFGSAQTGSQNIP